MTIKKYMHSLGLGVAASALLATFTASAETGPDGEASLPVSTVHASAPTGDLLTQANEPTLFDIPAGPLGDALVVFGDQSGVQIAVTADAVAGKAAASVSGTMTARDALNRLLAGSGLTYRFTSARAVSVETPVDDATMVLSPITVEGRQLADPGRTEGSDSYASPTSSVGSKIPLDVREIPQSVSVITQQRITDRNYTDLQGAIAETTGMRVTNYDHARADFRSRGHTASILSDGINVLHSTNTDAAPDMAIFDRVEVLRGPSGLFQGSGEPGGAINLVSKKPLNHKQANASMLIGSWQTYRGEVDVSSPLSEEDKVRGRLVAVYDDREDFVDLFESRKALLYGVVDVDLTEDTTASMSALYQQHNHHTFQGIPILYSDNTPVRLSRNTNIGAPWSKAEDDRSELHLDLSHRFDNGIEANLKNRAVFQNSVNKTNYVFSTVNTTSGNVTVRPISQDDSKWDVSTDANVMVPVDYMGQEQTFIFGSDYLFSREDREQGVGAAGTQNAFNPDHGIAEQDIAHTTLEKNDEEQFGIYGQARLKPGVDWLTAIGGGRFTWWNAVNRDIDAGTISSDVQINGKFTPFAGLIVDVLPHVSVYGSIFEPQTDRTPAGNIVEPREGNQYEVGTKVELMDGALIGHLAAYWIEDKNRVTTIDNCTGNCAEAAGVVRSQGIEAEVSGEILPGMQALVGYAYTNTKYVEDNRNQGNVFAQDIPKHMLNLSGRYSFSGEDLGGLSIGGNLRVMSSYFYANNDVRVTQEGFAILDAFVGYELTNNFSAQFAVNNITDEVYYERLGGTTRNNRWGAPRSVMFTLRGEF